ncbi:MAG: hypothetical protein H0T39_10905, partial [Actinobacteria bacterium]|nr:hypothetical protein [Actinomycetota bacterium]
LAALELAGVTLAEARPVLAGFRGAGRRFEPRGEWAGIRVYDDYGHHPTAVAATIAAARELAMGASTCSSSRTCPPARGIWRGRSAPHSPRPTRPA